MGKRKTDKNEEGKQSAPKKPKSGFMFFSQERRASLKLEQPNLKITDASKVIGKEWNKLTPEQKAPYNEQAQQDKQRYLREKGGKFVEPKAASPKPAEKASPAEPDQAPAEKVPSDDSQPDRETSPAVEATPEAAKPTSPPDSPPEPAQAADPAADQAAASPQADTA